MYTCHMCKNVYIHISYIALSFLLKATLPFTTFFSRRQETRNFPQSSDRCGGTSLADLGGKIQHFREIAADQ